MAFWGTLVRDSEGVRRGSDRGLGRDGRKKERVRRRKKGVGRVERAERLDLESWREGFEG